MRVTAPYVAAGDLDNSAFPMPSPRRQRRRCRPWATTSPEVSGGAEVTVIVRARARVQLDNQPQELFACWGT